jgi:DNA-binding CsgD family transcriptional regulator
MSAESSTTPADPRAELAEEIRVYLEEGWSAPPHAKQMLERAQQLLSLPDTEGVDAEQIAIAALDRMGAPPAWRDADARAVVRDLREAGLLRTLSEGVAPLRASGTPVQSVEVMAAEIEAHAAQAVPASDVDLLRALVSGLSLKEYAAREGLRPSAASQRANRMRQHLGASSNEQAVCEAIRRGLLKGVPRP